MKIIALFALLALVAGATAKTAGTRAEGPACPPEDPFVGTEGPLNITLHPIAEIHEGGTRG